MTVVGIYMTQIDMGTCPGSFLKSGSGLIDVIGLVSDGPYGTPGQNIRMLMARFPIEVCFNADPESRRLQFPLP
jgi:hypothetical protein